MTEGLANSNPTDGVISRPRIPAAANPAGWRRMWPGSKGQPKALRRLYFLVLLSTLDGSMLILAAGGAFASLASSVLVGLSVLAGFGAWLAAQETFGGRVNRDGWRQLAALGIVTSVATLASVWAGVQLATAVQLHVLPKVAGLVLCLMGADVAGLALARGRFTQVASAALGAGALVEVAWWSLS